MELEVCKRNGHRFQPWAPRSLPSRRGSRSTSGSSAGAQSLELDVLTDRHLRGAEAFRLAFLLPCELKQLYRRSATLSASFTTDRIFACRCQPDTSSTKTDGSARPNPVEKSNPA